MVLLYIVFIKMSSLNRIIFFFLKENSHFIHESSQFQKNREKLLVQTGKECYNNILNEAERGNSDEKGI